MVTIGLLQHPRDRRRELTSTIIGAIAAVYARDDHRVLLLRDPREAKVADVLVNRVDLTVLPPAFAAAVDRHQRTINGRVTDISKSRISDLILRDRDAWDGPVIVKTDRNATGTRRNASSWGRCVGPTPAHAGWCDDNWVGDMISRILPRYVGATTRSSSIPASSLRASSRILTWSSNGSCPSARATVSPSGAGPSPAIDRSASGRSDLAPWSKPGR